MSGFFSLILFLVVLTIGFVFEWQKGALEWNSILLLAARASSSSVRYAAASGPEPQQSGNAKAKRIVIYKFIFPALASRLASSGSARFFLPREGNAPRRRSEL